MSELQEGWHNRRNNISIDLNPIVFINISYRSRIQQGHLTLIQDNQFPIPPHAPLSQMSYHEMNHKRITEYKLTRLFISFIIMWILGFLFFRYNWNCNVNWSLTHRCTIFKKGEHFPLYIMSISTTKTAAHRSEWKKLFSYTKIWIWRLETRQDIVLLKE